MTDKPRASLDEINARIAEAEEWGNKEAAELAKWQKAYVERLMNKKQGRVKQ